MTLEKLLTGRAARVTEVGLDGALRERLAALGVAAGRPVEVIQRVGSKGPIKIRAGRTELVMRPAEAGCIRVEAV